MFDNISKIRGHLTKMGLPAGDLYALPDSPLRFPDGNAFKIEIPTINSPEACIAAIEESLKLNVQINRITETLGIFRHTSEEISQYVKACKEYGCELVMSPGPRATYDTGASAQTTDGKRIGYRLRGQDQLVFAIADLKRASDLGVTNFLIYDEGMLYTVNTLRMEGLFPSGTKFKVSAHCGHGNPASIALLAMIGADSINPVRDLQLPMLAALRAAVSIPLDIHTDNPLSSGGFIRTYEVPEIVRIASPVYLKTGNSAIKNHGERTIAAEARQMVKQSAIVMEFMTAYAPSLLQSKSIDNPS